MQLPDINSKVQSRTNSAKEYTDIHRMNSGHAAKEALREMAALEHCDDIEKQRQRSEKEYNNKQRVAKNVNKQILESRLLPLNNQLFNNGKTLLFKDILFELYRDSLYLDQSFISEQYDAIKKLSDSYVDKNGGIKMLLERVNITKSPILRDIYNVCESVARAVTMRKYTAAMEACKGVVEDEASIVNSFTFELNDDEQNSFDYMKKNLSLDELSAMVKQKVLDVVQDEKNRQSEEDQRISDIEDELQNNDNVTDEKSLQEAYKKMIIKVSPVEESTLFDSLLRSTYKELLESSVQIADSQAAHDDADKTRDNNGDVNLTKNDIVKTPGTAPISYSVSDEINKVSPGEDPLFDRGEFEIDMDMVLAESITKYTLMELMYTICIEDYKTETIQKISQTLLNPRKK